MKKSSNKLRRIKPENNNVRENILKMLVSDLLLSIKVSEETSNVNRLHKNNRNQGGKPFENRLSIKVFFIIKRNRIMIV